MKTLAVAMAFGFGWASYGMGVAQDLELSQNGYELIEIAEVNGEDRIKEGEFAGMKLVTKSKVTACARKVAPNGLEKYKCQEIINPPDVAKSLFGLPKVAGKVLAMFDIAVSLPSEESKAMYGQMQNVPEIFHGRIQAGDFAQHELFTRSIVVVYAKMVGPDGVKYLKKLMINPSLE